MDSLCMEKFITHREKLLLKMDYVGWQIMKVRSEYGDLNFEMRRTLLQSRLRGSGFSWD